MIIKIPVRFHGSHGEMTLYTLFDSGSTFSCIHPQYAPLIGLPDKMPIPMELTTADRGTYLKVDERITTDFYVDDIRLSDEFVIVPGLSEDAIIGAITMQKWRIKLDFEYDKVVIDPRIAEKMFKSLRRA